MGFDVEGAKKEEYSSEEIAQHLSKRHGFNYEGAAEEGYSPDEIINHLKDRVFEPKTVLAPVSQAGKVPKNVAAYAKDSSNKALGISYAEGQPTYDPKAGLKLSVPDEVTNINHPISDMKVIPELRTETGKPSLWDTVADAIKDPLGRGEGMRPADIADAQIRTEAKKANMPKEAYIDRVNPEGAGLRKIERALTGVGRGAVSTIEGMAGGGEWLSNGAVGRDLANQAKIWQTELSPDEMGFSDEFAGGIGSIATYWIPGIGIIRGATALAKVAPNVARWMGTGVSTAMEALTEAGFVYREHLNETRDAAKAEAAATETFWKNVALVGVTNRFGVFADKGGAARRGLTAGTLEGIQEGGQEIISTTAQDKPINWESVGTSAAVGAIIGGGIGTVTGAMDVAEEKRAKDEEAKSRFEVRNKPAVGYGRGLVPSGEARIPDITETDVQNLTGGLRERFKPAVENQDDIDNEIKAGLNPPNEPQAIPEIPAVQTTRPVSAPQKPITAQPITAKPVEKVQSADKTTAPRGVIPVAELWDKTPEDIDKTWGEATDHVTRLENEDKAKISELEKEYKPLKKKKDLLSIKRKKEIEHEIKNLKERGNKLTETYQGNRYAETEKLAVEAERKAGERGIAKEDLKLFTDDFMEAINPENYGKTISQIFDQVLKDYTSDGKEVEIDNEIPAPHDEIDQAAHEAATSPLNDTPQPTEAQKDAGNYKKGHINVRGLDISIENPKGSERSGVAPDGRKWSTELKHHYGYIKRTEGKDGDQIDVFVGEDKESDRVFVVNQIDPKTGKFDEHKIMLGFKNEEAAREGYLSNYEKGWKGLGSMSPMSMDEFKAWIGEGDTKKPVKAKPVTEQIKQETAKPAIKALVVSSGKTATAKTERGTKIEVKYAVVDEKELITSHDTSLSRNKEYPAELQPRERDRAASELQISNIVNYLEPEFLGESPKASEGSPIVGPDMLVESGNGRTIALKKAYEVNHKSAINYRKWLVENAEKFGLEASGIKKLKNPVLVRIRETDVDRVKFVQEANEQSVASMSASEQAKVDAQNLTKDLMSMFEPSEEGEINTARNRDFIRGFLNKIVPASEMGRYMTSGGEISQEGIRRIRNAIFTKAYGDTAVLEKLAESADNNIKQIINAMVAAGPRFAVLEEAIKNEELHNLNINKEIAQAAQKMSQLREAGQSFTDYLNQGALFDDGISPLAKDIIVVFDFYKKSGRKLRDIFSTYVAAVERLGSPKQEGLFGGFSLPNRAEILQGSIKKVAEDENVLQTTLFEGKASDVKEARTDVEKGGSRKEGTLERKQEEVKPSPKEEPATAEGLTAPAPKKTVPTKSAQQTLKPKTDQQIDDTGEKIGGARKDRWKERGLALSDLEGMTTGEEYAFVTKDEVWPKVDYQSLVEGGSDPLVVRAIKEVRDGIPTRPDRDTAEYRRAYVEMVGRIRDAALAAKKPDDILNLYNNVTKDVYERTEYSKRLVQDKAILLYSIGTKGQKALKFNSWTLSKLKREIDETGWPLKKKEKATTGKDEKELPDRPYLEHINRTGEDYRKGRNVTAQDFVDTFGFRGIEFGNWVNQDERQTNINFAFDALQDLSNLLDIHPKALSLDGTLGLAFGARGGGKFAAHYEPGKVVINLTKLRGAGTLAHEYAHALDHYFGSLDIWGLPRKKGSSGKPVYSSGGRNTYSKNKLGNLRPEMQEAWDGVMQAIFKRDKTRAEVVRDAELQLERLQADIVRVEGYLEKYKDEESIVFRRTAKSSVKNWKEWLAFAPAQKSGLQKRLAEARDENYVPTAKSNSSFYSESVKLGEYWQRPTELFARAFEAYVFDRIQEKELTDQYLVQGVEADRYSSDVYKGNPYPVGLERESIKKAFDKLIQTLETKPGTKPGSLAVFENLEQNHPEYKNDEKNLRIAETALKSTEQFELSFGRGKDIYTREREASGGVRTLGVGISAELAEKGYIDLRGRKAESAEDVAVLAQVYRNPQYETIRYFYVKDGKIVAHEGRTSRIPGAAVAFVKDRVKELYEIRQRMKRLGADGIWLVHNHPSGDPRSSQEDKAFTALLFKHIPGLKGHVVINSLKYAVLTQEEGWGHYSIREDIHALDTDDRILHPYIYNPLLGAHVGGKETLARIAQALKTPSDFMVAIYRDAKGFVRAIQELPIGLSNSKKALTDYLRGRAREFGSTSVYIAVPDGSMVTPEQESSFLELTEKGVLIDALLENSSVRERAVEIKGEGSTWMGAPIKGMRVSEEEIEENIAHGREAMDKVIRDHVDVKAAMHRADLGDISFYWGKPGDPAKGYKGGSGVSHIIAQRGANIATKMVEVIANGIIVREYGPAEAKRVDVAFDGHTAVLSLFKDEDRETWLLTGWKDDAFDVPGSDSALSGPMHSGPTLNRPDVGAKVSSPDSNISPAVDDVNKVKEEEAPYSVNENREDGPFKIKYDDGKIELSFKEKPNDEIRERLKKNGFKWNGDKKAWVASETEQRKEFVKRLKFQLKPYRPSPDPVDRTIVEDPKGVLGWLKKQRHPLGLKDEDMRVLERMFGLPWWIAKRYEEFKNIINIELKRQRERTKLINSLLRDISPFMTLPKTERAEVEKLIVESDKDNLIYQDAGAEGGPVPRLQAKAKDLIGKELNQQQVEAYYAVQGTMRRIRNLIDEWLKRLLYLPYEGRAWLNRLKKANEYLEKRQNLSREATELEKKISKLEMKKGDTDAEERELEAKLGAVNEEIAGLSEKMANIRVGLSPEEEREFDAALDKVRVDNETIGRLRREMGRIEAFMPRVREDGDYAIRVYETVKRRNKDVTRVIWHVRAKTERKAAKIKAELQEQFPGKNIVTGLEKDVPESLYQEVSDRAVEKFFDNAIETMHKQRTFSHLQLQGFQEAGIQTAADMFKKRGFSRHMIKRAERVIGGYQVENLNKVFFDYLTGMAGFVTKQEAAIEFGKALAEIPQSLPMVYEYASQYVKDQLRNTSRYDRTSAAFRSVAFAYYIAGNLKSAFVNVTQNYLAGIPELRKITKGATRKYHNAMRDITIRRRNLTEIEKEVLAELIDDGTAEAQYVNEQRNRLNGQFGRIMQGTIDFLAKPFQLIEEFNRKAAALARFRVALNEQKMSYEGARQEARDFVYNTHYLMGKANLPEAARGDKSYNALIRTSLTFRSYTHNYASWVISTVRGDGDAPIELKQKPDGTYELTRKQKERITPILMSMAWLSVFGGAMAWPLVDDLLDLFEWLFGIPARHNIREALRQNAGERAEQVGMHGIPALVGFDISGSMKIGVPALGDPSEAFAGVYGGLLNKAYRSGEAALTGQYLRAVEHASPVAAENFLKGYRMYTEWATDLRGKELLDEDGNSVSLTGLEAIGQSLGFRPERTASLSQEKRTFYNIDAGYYSKIRERITTKYRMAFRDGDIKGQDKAIEKLVEYNDSVIKYNGAIPLMGPDDLTNAIRQKPDKGFMRFMADTDPED